MINLPFWILVIYLTWKLIKYNKAIDQEIMNITNEVNRVWVDSYGVRVQYIATNDGFCQGGDKRIVRYIKFEAITSGNSSGVEAIPIVPVNTKSATAPFEEV